MIHVESATVLLLLPLALPLRQDPRPPEVAVRRAEILREVPPPQARAWSTDRSGRAAAVDLSAERLTLSSQSVVAVRTAEGPIRKREADGEHVLLPFRLQVVRPDGAMEDAGQPDLRPQGGALRYDAGARRFRGSVLAGLRADGAARTLSQPVTLLFSGSAEACIPSQLQLQRTNTYLEVLLEDSGAHAEVSLQVLPLGVPESEAPPSALTLPVERLPLELSVPSRLLGFGLEQEVVRVSARGALPDGEFPVQLRPGQGRIEPGVVVLGTTAFAEARLRSSGVGRQQVVASGFPFAEATEEVEYVLPLFFFAAALAGGAIGAVVQALRSRRGKLRGRDLALGLASGVLAAVAYTAGVNLIGLDFGTHMHEAIVFTIAALATLIGLPALERLRGAAATPNP